MGIVWGHSPNFNEIYRDVLLHALKKYFKLWGSWW